MTASCWRNICTGWERVACWDVLRSGGWVSHKHCTEWAKSRYRVIPYTIYYIMYTYFWATLYNKSDCVCVCVCVCVPVLNVFPWYTTGHRQAFQFSQSVVYMGGISVYLRMWNLTLGCVFSKSLSYTVSLFRQFRCRWETVSPTVLKWDLCTEMHIPIAVEA